jgi:hypothetical protein
MRELAEQCIANGWSVHHVPRFVGEADIEWTEVITQGPPRILFHTDAGMEALLRALCSRKHPGQSIFQEAASP